MVANVTYLVISFVASARAGLHLFKYRKNAAYYDPGEFKGEKFNWF